MGWCSYVEDLMESMLDHKSIDAWVGGPSGRGHEPEFQPSRKHVGAFTTNEAEVAGCASKPELDQSALIKSLSKAPSSQAPLGRRVAARKQAEPRPARVRVSGPALAVVQLENDLNAECRDIVRKLEDLDWRRVTSDCDAMESLITDVTATRSKRVPSDSERVLNDLMVLQSHLENFADAVQSRIRRLDAISSDDSRYETREKASALVGKIRSKQTDLERFCTWISQSLLEQDLDEHIPVDVR